jgi:hypothetical protein
MVVVKGLTVFLHWRYIDWIILKLHLFDFRMLNQNHKCFHVVFKLNIICRSLECPVFVFNMDMRNDNFFIFCSNPFFVELSFVTLDQSSFGKTF